MAKQKYEVIGREFNLHDSVLADIEIDRHPTFFSETNFINKEGKKITIPKRLVFRQTAFGGYITIFVYGAHPDDAGKTLPAVISPNKKITKSLKTGKITKVFYYDAKVRRDAKTCLKFFVSRTAKALYHEMPYIKMTFKGSQSSYIGFAKKV